MSFTHTHTWFTVFKTSIKHIHAQSQHTWQLHFHLFTLSSDAPSWWKPEYTRDNWFKKHTGPLMDQCGFETRCSNIRPEMSLISVARKAEAKHLISVSFTMLLLSATRGTSFEPQNCETFQRLSTLSACSGCLPKSPRRWVGVQPQPWVWLAKSEIGHFLVPVKLLKKWNERLPKISF